MGKPSLAVAVTIAFSVVGVLGDYLLQGSGIKLAILRRLVKACGRTTGHP
jgi:hypothetical protein